MCENLIYLLLFLFHLRKERKEDEGDEEEGGEKVKMSKCALSESKIPFKSILETSLIYFYN